MHRATVAALALLLLTAASNLAAQDMAAQDTAARETVADLIFTGGRIYTLDPANPWAVEVAIKDGRIVAVGQNGATDAWAGAGTRTIALAGQMLLPGFHDPHVHAVEAGVYDGYCFLPNGRPQSFYESRMRDCAARQPSNTWVRAAGPYADDLLNGPELAVDFLDRAIPSRPAVIVGGIGHSTTVNSRGLAEAGIDDDTRDPAGGIIDRDPATGRASGVLLEAAQHLALDASEQPTPEYLQTAYEGLLDSIGQLNRNGITSISDAGGYWTRGHVEPWQRALAEGRLTVRASNALYVFPYLKVGSQLRTLRSLFSNEPGSRLRFNQAKIYVDGILDLATGAVLDPYQGTAAGSRGMTYFRRGRLNRYAKKLQAAGFQLHFHAVGDRGVRLALNAIQKAGTQPASGRPRVTHLYLIAEQDRPRFDQLDVFADLQMGSFTTTEAYVRELSPLLGQARAQTLLPLGSLNDAGAPLVLSSDWDAESLSPFETIERALTRPREAAPDLATVLRMMTINAARLLGQDEETGSIEVGKLADLVVVDRDLFAIPVGQIGNAEVVMTLLEGETVYERSARAPEPSHAEAHGSKQ
jgi:predicted amidohydrolase YtcJ